jgi:chromosome segregation ATPase
MKNFFDRIFGRQQLKEQLAKLTVLRASDQITLAARDREISDLLSRNTTLKTVERTLRENEKELIAQVEKREIEKGNLRAQLETANLWIKEAATTIAESQKAITELQNELNTRLDQFNELVQTNNSLSRQIQTKDATIQDLQIQLAACQSKIELGSSQAPVTERRSHKLKSLKSK